MPCVTIPCGPWMCQHSYWCERCHAHSRKSDDIIANSCSTKSLLTCSMAVSLQRARHSQPCQETCWDGKGSFAVRSSNRCTSSALFPPAPWPQWAPLSLPCGSLVCNPSAPPSLCRNASQICNKMSFRFPQHLLPCAKWNIIQPITTATSTHRDYSFLIKGIGIHKFSINFSFTAVVIRGAERILPYIMPTGRSVALALFPPLSLRLCQCFH